MRRWLKWFLFFGVLAGVVALSIPVMAWLQERSLPKYITVTATRGRVETVVNSTGIVKPVRTVSVGAFTSGPIAKIFVDFNQEITEKEMVLAVIDDRILSAAVERDAAILDTQKADLIRVEAQLTQAIRKEDRARKLLAINPDYLSGTEMDEAHYPRLTLEAQKKLVQASIKQAEANLKNSVANHSYTKIKGPKEEIDPALGIKGRVIDRKVEQGQTVASSYQTPELFTIAIGMDKHMHVYASIDEADIGMVDGAKKHDKVVKFTVDAYPGELFEGKIHDIRLNSTTTQNVVTYPVIVDAPNRGQKLKPGMTANITFQIESKEDVLRVPAAALRFTPLSAQVHPDDRRYLEAITTGQAVSGVKRSAHEKAGMAQGRSRRTIWIQDGEWLRAIPIILGLTENQFAEVVAGELKEGQEIVTGVEGALPPR